MITIQTTEQEIEDLCYDAEIDMSVRTDYSGRGMYGKECLALVGAQDDVTTLMLYLAYQAGLAHGRGYEPDLITDLYEAFKESSMCTDNMGLSMVYYWPSIQIEEG